MKHPNLGAMIATAVLLSACQQSKPSQSETPASTGAVADEPGDAASPDGGGTGDEGNGEGGQGADGEMQLEGEWSLAERSTWEKIYADRTQYLNLMNTACGSSITMSFDHAAFRDRLAAVDANRNEDWNVSPIINAIASICREGAMQKTAVATRINALVFVRKPGSKHSLNGRTLTIALDLDANPREYVNNFSAWLRKSI